MWNDFILHPEKSVIFLQLTCQRKDDGSSNYWADELTNQVTGSRLWTLRGSQKTKETEDKAKLFVKEALPNNSQDVTTKTLENILQIYIHTGDL